MNTTINDDGPAVVIPLKNGGAAVVSPEDADLVLAHKWRLGTNGYVYRVGGRVAGVPCLLHRIVMYAKSGQDVHHKSQDKTDCRRCNLETLTPAAHQEHHKHQTIARNIASRKYSLTGVCKRCGLGFTKDPSHRGRQVCCSKSCAIRIAIAARKEKHHA